MKRYVILFAVTFAVVWAGAYISAVLVNCRTGGTGTGSEAHRALLREAHLVEHFCLSRIPPVIGRPSVPSEWETALNTTIRLRGNVGEIAAMAPDLAPKLDEVRALQPGQSVFATSKSDQGRQNVLVYQPKADAHSYLVLLKSASAPVYDGDGSGGGFFWLTLLIGLAGGLVLTGLGALFLRRRLSMD